MEIIIVASKRVANESMTEQGCVHGYQQLLYNDVN